MTRIPHEGKTPPIRYNTDKHERFLRALLDDMADLEEEARVLFKKVSGQPMAGFSYR